MVASCYAEAVAASRHARTHGVLVLVALSTGLALGVETAVRRLMMPPELEQVRAWLSPTLEPWAWGMVPLTGLASAGAWWLYGVLVRRALSRARPGLTPAQALARAELDAAILASSAPQLPAVAGTMLFMMGAPLLPVGVAMGVAVLGVLSLGLRVRRGVAVPDPAR